MRPALIVLSLAQRPWLILNDVLVDCCNQTPGRFQRPRKLALLEKCMEISYGLTCSVGYGALVGTRLGARWIRNLDLEVPRDQGKSTAGQVAQAVRQVGVVTLHQGVE